MSLKADGFRELAAASLEEYARGVLNVESILANAATNAANGERSHSVLIERPVDLPQSLAAKKLKEILTKHGFRMEWNKRPMIIAGAEKTAWTLIVSW